MKSPGYEALAQGEKVGQPFLGVLLHTSRAATEKKNSYHQKVHERHSAALHSLCCNNGSRCLAEGKLIKMVHRTAAFYKELLSELEAIFT